jgi:hypothetical protein
MDFPSTEIIDCIIASQDKYRDIISFYYNPQSGLDAHNQFCDQLFRFWVWSRYKDRNRVIPDLIELVELNDTKRNSCLDAWARMIDRTITELDEYDKQYLNPELDRSMIEAMEDGVLDEWEVEAPMFPGTNIPYSLVYKFT